MMRGSLGDLAPTRDAAFSASETDIVGPPMIRTSAPVASLSSTRPSRGR